MSPLYPLAVLSLVVALAWPGQPWAGQALDDLDAPVTAGSPLTYRKLVGAVFKGVQDDPDSDDLVTVASKTLPRPGSKERTILPPGTHLKSFEAIRVRGDGRRYLVMFWSAETEATDVPGGGASILAVFPEGSAEPQDVAEVKTDVLCSLVEGPMPALGPDDAFAVLNHHFNSNQGYLDTTLFHIHGGRLRLAASVFTLQMRGLCDKSFTEELAWRTEPDQDSPYPKVVATVTLRLGAGEDEGRDCPKPKDAPRTRVFSETYLWSKAQDRFIGTGRGFRELDRFNQSKF